MKLTRFGLVWSLITVLMLTSAILFPREAIILSWLGLVVAAVVFLGIFGRPRKYVDRTMAWHLVATTAIAGLEPIGLMLSGLSLEPSAIIYVGSLSVMAWRIALLVKQKQAQKRARRDALLRQIEEARHRRIDPPQPDPSVAAE